MEINPVVQGTQFYQDVPGVKVQGDSFTSFVPLAGISQPANGHSLGLQYVTPGDVLEPEAHTVLIRVSPILVSEPSVLGLALVALPLLVLRRRLMVAQARIELATPAFSVAGRGEESRLLAPGARQGGAEGGT